MGSSDGGWSRFLVWATCLDPSLEGYRATVKLLGYPPNFGARALAAKQTKTIGAVIPTMENAIFARGLQAFQETISENGSTLLIASSSYQRQLEEEQIRTLLHAEPTPSC